ncbi:unnamed protein product [Bemisia tabaci]|uniref:DNA 3'-5' helicase n=1 Tax=Bemisia tabaci TaxID=7038 RepID=A0AAI8UVD5_BEMTA|nr:unnamed protein product [Bemisia tabaci]
MRGSAYFSPDEVLQDIQDACTLIGRDPVESFEAVATLVRELSKKLYSFPDVDDDRIKMIPTIKNLVGALQAGKRKMCLTRESCSSSSSKRSRFESGSSSPALHCPVDSPVPFASSTPDTASSDYTTAWTNRLSAQWTSNPASTTPPSSVIGVPSLSDILEAGPSHSAEDTITEQRVAAIQESENSSQKPVTFKPPTTGPTKPMAESTNYIGFARIVNKDIASLTKVQLEGITSILDGKDTVLRMPTGSGKTITYIIPPLIVPPKVVIVLVPLIALLEDLFMRLHSKIHIIDLRSTKLTWSSISDYNSMILKGTTIFFLSTHETFLGQRKLHAFLEKAPPKGIMIVHDEAHTVPSWGVEFRPSLLSVRNVINKFGVVQHVFVSATLTSQDIEFLKGIYGIGDVRVISDLSLRKEISYKVIDITDVSETYKSLDGVEKNPMPLLTYLNYAEYPNQQFIIFAENIERIKRIRAACIEINVEPAIFYGSLTDARKTTEITNWLTGSRQILLATSAVSLGVSNPRCSVTVHLGASSSVNNFIQESGRAGRMGQESTCLVILDPSFTYRRMCQSIEYRQSLDLNLHHNIKPGTISKGNNQVLAWYVVTQRHTCIQQILIKSIDPSATPDKCGKCSNCTRPVKYEHLNLELPLRNFLLHVREVEDRRGACLLAVAKFFTYVESAFEKENRSLSELTEKGIFGFYDVKAVLHDLCDLIIRGITRLEFDLHPQEKTLIGCRLAMNPYGKFFTISSALPIYVSSPNSLLTAMEYVQKKGRKSADKTNGNSRSFHLYSSSEYYYNSLRPKTCGFKRKFPSMYEIITDDRNVKIYLDVEWPIAEGEDPEPKFRELRDAFENYVNTNIEPTIAKEYFWSVTKYVNKASYHLVVNGVMFKTKLEARGVAEDFRSSLTPEQVRKFTVNGKFIIDFNVYTKTQQFRMLYSTKLFPNKEVHPLRMRPLQRLLLITLLNLMKVIKKYRFAIYSSAINPEIEADPEKTPQKSPNANASTSKAAVNNPAKSNEGSAINPEIEADPEKTPQKSPNANASTSKAAVNKSLESDEGNAPSPKSTPEWRIANDAGIDLDLLQEFYEKTHKDFPEMILLTKQISEKRVRAKYHPNHWPPTKGWEVFTLKEPAQVSPVDVLEACHSYVRGVFQRMPLTSES